MVNLLQLNRALLFRQMLTERRPISVTEAIRFHLGFQSQAPNPPYFALWNRLESFSQADLSNLVASREVVRIALMRSTIFLVTGEDCRLMRPLAAPVLERGYRSNYGQRAGGLDVYAVAAAGRRLVEERPRTFKELGTKLGERWPDYDLDVLAQAIRTFVPLVQVPPRGQWGSTGQATHTSSEFWLGEPLLQEPSIDDLVVRYFAAFGPATIQDLQYWCGLTRLREVVERNPDRLIRSTDDRGRELYDWVESLPPPEDLPVPVRFLGEFDNVLLSHADKSHILAEKDKGRVFTVNGIIRSTILVDGFVHGTWRLHSTKQEAWLEVQPFRSLTRSQIVALEEEGDRLLRFATENKIRLGVRFLEAE